MSRATNRAVGMASSVSLMHLGRRGPSFASYGGQGGRPHRPATLALLAVALLCTQARAAVHYVSVTSTNPVPPFADWNTASITIQDAIDSADNGDVVLVTNGVYNRGGYPVNGFVTNRAALVKPITLQSVNGPSRTFIEGTWPLGSGFLSSNAVRCAYLTDGAVLAGFTLTNGGTAESVVDANTSGAGAWCESTSCVLSNCVLTGSFSDYGNGGGAYSGTLIGCVLTNGFASVGGGAFQSTLSTCLIVSNVAYNFGGGVYECTLENCTIVGNLANGLHGNGRGAGANKSTLNNCTLVANGFNHLSLGSGGGSSGCTLNNCIIYFNAGSLPNDDGTSTMNYCCTTPLFGSGNGNISAQPRLVNPTQLDVHLQPNSPCINAGQNNYVSSPRDLDGNQRITGGTVDIGAYEYPNPTSTISYAWLQQYGLPTDGSADQADTDGDGMNNWQEWICGTNPTNAASVLQLLPPLVDPSQVTVVWQSVTNRNYFVQRSSDMSVKPAFQTIATNLPGQLGATSFIDTTAQPPGPFFYRVGVGQ